MLANELQETQSLLKSNYCVQGNVGNGWLQALLTQVHLLGSLFWLSFPCINFHVRAVKHWVLGLLIELQLRIYYLWY